MNIKIKIIIGLVALFLPFSSWAAEPIKISGKFSGVGESFAINNGIYYFSANDGTTGYELWKSDGTEAGTVLVKDINPSSGGISGGSYPSGLVTFQNQVFFSASDGVHGTELWKTDGTEAGTVLVKDINIGSGGGAIANIIVYNNAVYFMADDGTNGGQLWKTDGTETGTEVVMSVISGAAGVDYNYNINAVQINNQLYFTVYDWNSGGEFLWKTDGTASGTTMIKQFNSINSYLTELNGNNYFIASSGGNQGLWKTDGTASGTSFVLAVNGFSSVIYNFGGSLYFNLGDGQLYKSDGTVPGTTRLKLFSSKGLYGYTDWVIYNGKIYFGAKLAPSVSYELWQSDGTASGTVLVKDVNTGSENYGPAGFVVFNNELYFVDNDGTHGLELFKTDGTASGTVLVKDINVGSADFTPKWFAGTPIPGQTVNYGGGFYPVEFKNTLLFNATDGNDYYLWTIDPEMPTTPLNLMSTPGIQKIMNLDWAASSDNLAVTKYNVFRNGIKIAQPTTSTYADTDTEYGINYTYQVSAIDTSGNESTLSATVSITMPYPVVVNSVNIPLPTPTVSIPTPITITPTTGSQGTLSVSGVSNAKYIAVSTRPDFSQSSWELYTDTYKLAEKTKGKVYVKFRSQEGGETAPVEVTIPVGTSINQPGGNGQGVITPTKPTIVKPTPKPQEIKSIAITVNLAPGSKHTQVKQLQKLLVKQGLLKQQDVIGIYGPKTVKAVKVFQQKNKLPQTGTLGPLTRKVLSKKK